MNTYAVYHRKELFDIDIFGELDQTTFRNNGFICHAAITSDSKR